MHSNTTFKNIFHILFFFSLQFIVTTIYADVADPDIPRFLKSGTFSAGLLSPDPTAAKTKCEAKFPNKCWYVDAGAPNGGNGSRNKPFNSFEKVVGYRTTKKSYVLGKIRGGDYLYLTGTFDMDKHIENGGKTIRLFIGDPKQGGNNTRPTVIKSLPGKPRAVFDGKSRRIASMDVTNSGLIHIRTSKKEPIGNIKFENLEIKNADGIGISFGENVIAAELNNIEVHDTNIKNGNSSSGAVHFRMTHGKTNFTVKNSLFYRNYWKEGGKELMNYNGNNVGGINILTSQYAKTGSTIEISNNIFYDEIYAIRHKKSGNINTKVSSNFINHVKAAFYIRAYNNDFHHNVIDNAKNTVLLSAENQHADISVKIRNNTVVNSEKLLNTGYEIGEYQLKADVQRNLFSSSTSQYPLSLHGGGKADSYPLQQFISANNIYDITTDKLLKHEKSYYSKYQALKKIKDFSSSFQKIRFKSHYSKQLLDKYIIDTNVTKNLQKSYSIGAIQ